MNDIAIIIPIHEFNDGVSELLQKALESVPSDVEVRVSCRNGLSASIKKNCKKYKNVKIYENEGADSPHDFCSLVNQAVGGTKWFSILEYDDKYTDIWFDNFRKYADSLDDVSVFIPMEDLMDYENREFIGIGNEAVWASSFSSEIGFVDNESIQDYFDFYMTGSVFKTDDWEEIGGLKPSIKLTFWYEFLLRATYMGKKVFVVPKIGYTHYLGREGSLIETYKKEIGNEESAWWMNVAKKEYFFKEERGPEKYEFKPSEESAK